jgi:nucleotide-binding universal stress UspA family protein
MWSVMEIWRDSHGESCKRVPNAIVEYEAAETAHATRILAAASEQAGSKGIACETIHVADRHPADGIVTSATEKGCDLIVTASHGRRGVGRLLLGSQANEVVTHSKVPTLIVR